MLVLELEIIYTLAQEEVSFIMTQVQELEQTTTSILTTVILTYMQLTFI